MAGSSAAPRLQLVWPGKDEFLLSPKDETGKPVWVPRTHPAASEVRLVDWTGRYGTVNDADPTHDNLLFTGDSLDVLRILAEHPEFSREYRNKVKCVYIDPPFNTGQAFEHYDDWMEHSTWLSFMRDRLLLIKDLLAPEGSVWVHLDDAEQHHMRCLMDEVFGAGKFVATVVWQKRYSRDNRPAIGSVHDYIMVYAPSGNDWKHHRNRIVRTGAKEYRNPTGDPRGPWRVVPMTAQGFRPNQMYEITSPVGVSHVPPKGRCWGMVRETFDLRLAEGRVYFGLDGKAQPGIIRFLDEDEGLVPWTWWPHEEVGNTDEAKKEIRPRLERVVSGMDPGGVSGALTWVAGGGFRSVKVSPSMYNLAPDGTILLADWATNGRFSRGVAAQLGFDFDLTGAPFCGRRGLMLLAVLDGSVGPEEVRALAAGLSENERVTVAAKVVLPGAEELLGSLSKGSRIRKAPRDVLADGSRRARRREKTP